MSIRGLADKTKIKLWAGQNHHAETIEWLLDQSDANAGEGRTTLLALGFIDAAMKKPGQEVFFFDHLIYKGSRIMERAVIGFLRQIGFEDDFEVTRKYILKRR